MTGEHLKRLIFNKMTYRELKERGELILRDEKIEESENDSMLLLLNASNIDKAKYLLLENEEVLKDIEKKYLIDIENRATNYPLQYIIGMAYFYGLEIKVNENVLIPRSDTETLVDNVLKENKNKNIRVLDLCTGSGCIAIALKKYGEYEKVVASDISKEAIKLAKENAKINDANISFLESDLLDNIEGTFDIITINPPYIRKGDIDSLQKEVRLYEPKIALDGGEDGLMYYKKLATSAKNFLNKNGKIYMEIGYDEAEDIKKIFSIEDYKNIILYKDLLNNDRVIKVEV